MKIKSFIIAMILTVGTFTSLTSGQNSDNKNGADTALRGSGRINPSTLAMEIDIPLGEYPGRGLNVPISLNYSSKVWRMEHFANLPVSGGNYSSCHANYDAHWSEESASGWTTSLAAPYIEYTGANNLYNADGTPISYDDVDCPTSDPPTGSYPVYFVRRLVVHLPSGETHELRASDAIFSYPVGEGMDATDWNTTFYATDGSNIKYVQDSTTNLYRLLMPDGSYYDFSYAYGWANKANKYTDRNGNYMTYDDPTKTWTDTLGKSFTAPLASTPGSPTTQTYQLPGLNGTTGDRPTYKFYWKQLKGSSADESGLTNFSLSPKPIGDVYTCYNPYPTQCILSNGSSLFYGDGDRRVIGGNSNFNPLVLTAIEMPDGQKYKFSYDIYARIETITYPTGGKEVFEYEVVPTLSVLNFDDLAASANFGVTDRKVYPNANEEDYYHWTYEADYVSNPDGYRITAISPDGTKIERIMHQGIPAENSAGFGYDNGLAGMAFEEKVYDNSNPRNLKSKKLTTWTKSALSTSGAPATVEADWHPRVTQEESQIFEGGSGLSTTSKFYYEGNLNNVDVPLLQNKAEVYAFVPVGSSLPSNPLRTTETTYSTNSAYLSQNMVGLITSLTVKDSAGTIVSRNEIVYDESGYSPNVGRGNPTSSRFWDSTKGAWNSSNAYTQTRAKYDSYGNQYEKIDARGNSTTTTFDSTYHVFPIQVTTPVPSDGTYGSNTAFVTYATFNTTTGLPLTNTGINGLETRITYDAATLRPLNTKTYYQNNQIGTTSEDVYHDETNNYWVKNRSQIDTDKWIESITYFDGLGRAYKSENIDSQGNIFVEKEFDDQGRVKRVTNPYRSGETKRWTTNTYDEASRLKEVTMPDDTKITRGYNVSTSGTIGTVVTITDQANKQRRSITNALGELVRVDEPNASGQLGTISSPNQPTSYTYNGIGKMVNVTQGSQNRFFMYDSLGRLLRIRQPEQIANSALNTTGNPDNNNWTAGFTYDDNGNILTSKDANNVTVTYTYDNLNRVKTKSYSDSTPQVSYKYDLLTNGKGALIETSSTVSTSKITQFTDLGKVSSFQQVTDGQSYTSTYQYNSVGVLVGETYPSTRTVNYDLNAEGYVSRVWGQSGQTQKTYANSFKYNPSGDVERMRLGNGLWDTAKFNSTLQVTELGLGYSSTDTSVWKVSLDYGELQTNGSVDTSKNSGNIAKQTLTFSGMTNSIVQTYAYDSLYRLSESKETSNGTQNWIQTIGYDRYGNRTSFNQTIGSQQTTTTPAVEASTNRFSSGYTYDSNGNITVDPQGRQFIFNGENKQTQVKDVNNNVVGTYYYDGDGRRVKKVVPSTGETTVFVYDAGAKLVAEYSTIVESSSTAKTSYLTGDQLGSPRVVTDAYAQVVSRRDFMPFGEEIYAGTGSRSTGQKYSTSSVDNVRKRFTGYEKDGETGLDFAEARYYDNNYGRFNAVDPLLASGKSANPQTFNRYTYTMNNPVNFTDPSGMLPESTCACGMRCPNSGSYLDGGAFKGTDTSVKNAFDTMALYREIDSALDILESEAWMAETIAAGATPEQARIIKESIRELFKSNKKDSMQIASDLINSGVTIGVTSNAQSGTDVTNPLILNAAIKAGTIKTRTDAMGFFTISIAEREFKQPTKWIGAAVEANIMHEAVHVTNAADVIVSDVAGGSYDVSNEADEREAKTKSFQYEIDRGGEWVKHGEAAGYIKKGKLDTAKIESVAKAQTGTVRGWMKGRGVVFNR